MMISILTSLLLGTLTGAPGSAPTSGFFREAAALDSNRTPVLEVPYDSADMQIYVPATINGRVVTLLLDYVTDSTVLSKTGLAKAGLTAGGAESITIGTSVLPGVPIHVATVPMADSQADGILGTAELTHYDLVVDWTTHTAQLYAVSPDTRLVYVPPPPTLLDDGGLGPTPIDSFRTDTEDANLSHDGWLPPGIVPENCTPLLNLGRANHLVFFSFQMNGSSAIALFNPRMRYVNIYGFWNLWFGGGIPGMQAIDGKALGFCLAADQCARGELVSPSLILGRRRVPISDYPVHIFHDMPSRHWRQIDFGLYGAIERRFVVSYSTGQVCMANARK